MIMRIFGGMSKGERNRFMLRSKTAMAQLAREGDQFLGGRPPYGYRLIATGPHPNPSKAATGQKTHKLVTNAETSLIVKRIFREYASGKGIHTIAEGLNRDGIPSPSGYDPARNSHRASGRGMWGKSAIRAILKNPVYKGQRVWNKVSKVEKLIDPENTGLGYKTARVPNPESEWTCRDNAHEAIVTAKQYADVQEVFRQRGHSKTRRERTKNPYLLNGRVFCEECGRRMQGATPRKGTTYYRCKFATEYANGKGTHPKSINAREDRLTPPIDAWLAQLFDEDNINSTCEALAEHLGAQPGAEHERREIEREISSCESKLEKYRLALDAGAEPAIVVEWIAEISSKRRLLEDALSEVRPTITVSADQIQQTVKRLGGFVSVLAQASHADRKAVYDELNLKIVYSASGHMTVSAGPGPCTYDGVGGGVVVQDIGT